MKIKKLYKKQKSIISESVSNKKKIDRIKIDLEHISKILSNLNSIMSPILNEEVRGKKLEIEFLKTKLNKIKEQSLENINLSKKLDSDILISKKRIELLNKIAQLLKKATFNESTLDNIQQIVDNISKEDVSIEKLLKIEDKLKKVFL